MLYCKSEAERDEWVGHLQHAAAVVPIEDDYVLGKELGDQDILNIHLHIIGRGRFSVVKEGVHKRSGECHSTIKRYS